MADPVPLPPMPLDPPWRFQFFQLLRILESRHPQSVPLGDGSRASDEQIRLRPSTSLAYPTTEVVDMREQTLPDGGLRLLVTTNADGLYGVGTPLPLSYAREILRDDEDQPQIRAFLDLFHHRLLSLWYRAWKRHRHEQSFRPEPLDVLSRVLLDFVGVPAEATAADLGTEPIRLLRYLGLLTLRTRPAYGLAVLLSEELQMPVTVEQLPTRWVSVSPEQWSRLSGSPAQRGRLGHDLALGTRRRDCSGELRLHIGPVSYVTLLSLRQGGALHARLIALARFYLRQPLDLSLYIRVSAQEIPRTQFGGTSRMRMGQPACCGPPREDPVLLIIPASLKFPCTAPAAANPIAQEA